MAYKKGFNKYKIVGDSTEFYITNKKGENLIVYIDTEDLPRLIEFNCPWTGEWKPWIESYYIHATKYLGKINDKYKYENVELHRFITNAPEGFGVDHIDNNGLNNKKLNLRLTNKSQNAKNRKGKNSNNKSGYRNVSWNSYYEKWVVQIQINGKNNIIGYYDDVHEAGKIAEETREKYYGEYKGKN